MERGTGGGWEAVRTLTQGLRRLAQASEVAVRMDLGLSRT